MPGLKRISSDQLLAQLRDLVHRGCKLEADLIAHLAEVDERRLFLREGCSSMFAYCVEVLRFAEAVAYKRIAAMRAARRYPELLAALRKGDLHLTAVSLLAPQLNAENVTALLAAARHRTADEIRRMLADRQPKPDATSFVRRLSDSSVRGGSTSPSDSSARCVSSSQPTRPSGATAPSPRPPEPLGDERYLIRFTADRELHAQIQELTSLMRHQIPDGDVGKVLAQAVAVLLKQARARKFGACSDPRTARREQIVETESVKRIGSAERAKHAATPSSSRRIPAAIRRAVSKRDGERCTFSSATGRRCGSRDFLEFHHREPWARQRSHTVDGITLRCRAHNQYAAERDFGAEHMERFRRRDRGRDHGQAAASLSEPSTIFSETASSLPETSSSLPETSSSLPETSSSLPETSSSLTETSSSLTETPSSLAEATAS